MNFEPFVLGHDPTIRLGEKTCCCLSLQISSLIATIPVDSN